MQYDEEKDEYTCHNGKQLKMVGTTYRKSASLWSSKKWIQLQPIFNMRKTSVKTEFILLCIGYNINKLHSKIQNDRCGRELHELKIS